MLIFQTLVIRKMSLVVKLALIGLVGLALAYPSDLDNENTLRFRRSPDGMDEMKDKAGMMKDKMGEMKDKMKERMPKSRFARSADCDEEMKDKTKDQMPKKTRFARSPEEPEEMGNKDDMKDKFKHKMPQKNRFVRSPGELDDMKSQMYEMKDKVDKMKKSRFARSAPELLSKVFLTQMFDMMPR